MNISNQCYPWLARELLVRPGRLTAVSLSLLAMFLCGGLAYIARLHSITHDLYHELALAREAATTGVFPIGDRFAFTPTVYPAVHHEWGTGWLLYLMTVETGLNEFGLMLVKFLLIAVVAACCYRVHRMRGGGIASFAVLGLLMFPIAWVGFTTLRAQLFTLAAIALQMLMLEHDWRGRRVWVVFWFLLYVIWLNVHAGFVVGLGMLGFHFVERCVDAWTRDRSVIGVLKATWHLLVLGPLAVVGIMLNPYGWQYVPYLARALSMRRPLIAEWAPLWETYDPFTTLICFAISIALIVYAFRERRWSRLRGGLFLVVCALMALKHIRHGSIYGVIWIAYLPAWIAWTPLAKHCQQIVTAHRGMVVRGSLVIATASLGFALWQPFWRPTVPGASPGMIGAFPVGAVEYLKQNRFHGNLLTNFDAGAYVSWKLYPETKVSLDGRYEVAFAGGVMEAHRSFYLAEPNSEEILARWKVDAFLVPCDTPRGEQLLEMVKLNDESRWTCHGKSWRCCFRDAGYMVWVPAESTLPTKIHLGRPAQGRYP